MTLAICTPIKPESIPTGILSLLCKELGDLFSDFAIRELDIILGGTIIRHERKETIVGNVELCQCC